MSLNIARDSPIFFSNNVLEAIRDRIHTDFYYYSFSVGLSPTVEGIYGMDSLMKFLSQLKKAKGLTWNKNLASVIDPAELINLNVFNTNIFEMQDNYENYIKETLLEDHDFMFETLKVLFEYNTTYGFEVIAN